MDWLINEVFCMELMYTCGNHMQAQVPTTPCDCLLHLGSGISQVSQSWHTCFKLTLWQSTLSQSTAITWQLMPWPVEHCAFRWVDPIGSTMCIAVQTVSIAMHKWLLGIVQMTFCVCMVADHCCQKPLSKHGRLHRLEGSKAASL